MRWVCFAGASHGELFDTNGRKLLGLAQVRKKQGIAVMMGIHLNTIDWDTVFSVFQEEFTQSELLTIANITADLSASGFSITTQLRATLLRQFLTCFQSC